MNKRILILVGQLLPAIVFVGIWEAAVKLRPDLKFFFGAPSEISQYFLSRTLDGSLPLDTAITLFEAVVGFLIGNIVGCSIGMMLWYSRVAMLISKPYIVAFGAAPIFALAPILIVWFGTGIFSKIMTAALSTVFVALFHAYSGAVAVDKRYTILMQSLGASKIQTFRKLIAPAVVVWVVAALRLNVGFALLGAFIGEFLSSSRGLGHLILSASGLFNTSLLLCGVGAFVLTAIALSAVISWFEPHLQRAIVRVL